MRSVNVWPAVIVTRSSPPADTCRAPAFPLKPPREIKRTLTIRQARSGFSIRRRNFPTETVARWPAAGAEACVSARLRCASRVLKRIVHGGPEAYGFVELSDVVGIIETATRRGMEPRFSRGSSPDP